MSEPKLAKTYDPGAIEESIYQRWEESQCFGISEHGENAYCIMIPPPNVTGSLHMGHAFQYTIMDILIRYRRMQGEKVLWQVGTDHAGIATQMVVERRLANNGISRHDLGRKKFTDAVWDWKAQSGNTITRQLRRMGASVDWSRERFTMDEGLSDAVQEVFVRLHEEGLIYRGKRLVNWDTKLHTAVSDLEVIASEENGHLWHLRYPVDGSPDEQLVVATTRPETMLGDSAVAVHPEDERYSHLVGKQAILPLTGRTIPIIADEYVDPEFGSGCVKITPAHDFNDYEVGLRHDLPQLNIFTPDAAIDLPNSDYHGMDRFDARRQIVSDLKNQGLLDQIEDHSLMVPRGDRSGTVIEPYLTDQWFVRTEPLAREAIRAVEDGDIRFVPENWSNTYYEWMKNIQDWCISRQIWWGHRIPAWYDDSGNIFVARNLAEAQKLAGEGVDLRQDEDVLDTWFSSALWPFSTLGWPEETPELGTFYPTNVLVTGFDIIFFWVARMIMMGLKFTGDVPFREVYIHGLVRDHDGQKMSKSKGNVLDPIDLIDGIDLEALVAKRTTGLMQPEMAPRIEKATRKEFSSGIPSFGTDALRFTFASQATLGRDIRFDMGRVEGNRNFCNKLWNAARFVLMNTEGHDCGQGTASYLLAPADRWIISRLQQVEDDAARHIADYRFDQLAQCLYSFIWDEYCSWYLEIAKILLNDEGSSDEERVGTRRTLVRVLETLMRLLHPLMPFITERIWQEVKLLAGAVGDTVMLCSYPEKEAENIDLEAVADLEWVQAVITGVRNIRGEMNIEPAKPLPVILMNVDNDDITRLEVHRTLIEKLGRIESIDVGNDDQEMPESATALIGEMRLLIPLGAFIDRDAEIARLEKELSRQEGEIGRARSKLQNDGFIAKAPAEVVNKEQQKLAESESACKSLKEQLDKIKLAK